MYSEFYTTFLQAPNIILNTLMPKTLIWLKNFNAYSHNFTVASLMQNSTRKMDPLLGKQ